jgi:hypothetical protein
MEKKEWSTANWDCASVVMIRAMGNAERGAGIDISIRRPDNGNQPASDANRVFN